MSVDTTSKDDGDPAHAVTRVSFRLRACLAHRSLAIDLVSTLTEHVKDADRGFRNAIITAFGEAFNNVAIHGYRNRADGMLDVEADLGPDYMTLRLMDTGNAVDLSSVSTPDLDGLPEGGLGVFMIFALVDEVVYRGGNPNVLSLTKRTTPAERPLDPQRESASK